MSIVSSTLSNNCYHCGKLCDTQDIVIQDKKFCCEGCKTVFELLDGGGLCDYYAINDQPGKTITSESRKQLYKALDNGDIGEQFVVFKNETTVKVKFYIPAMHCSSCIYLLENLNRITTYVQQSEVNFNARELFVTYDPTQGTLGQLVETLDKIGYDPDLGTSSTSAKKKQSRKLIYQLGLAGFSFGNIMLLSFPEYLSGVGTLELEFKQFFGYTNFVFAVPVLLFCTTDYFKSAYKGLMNKYINIDVPISLGIIALFLRSSIEIFSGAGSGYMDSFTGLMFFLLIGKWFQQRTYEALSFERDYKSYFPIAITKVEKGEEIAIQLHEVKIGDRLIIHSQEVIPADAILLSPNATIDYSFVTGEQNPVGKKEADLVYAGGRQTGSMILVEVIKEVSQSYLTRLWNQQVFTEEKSSPYKKLIDKLGQNFTLIVIGLSAVAAAVWYFIDAALIVHVVTSILIVACPCALSLAFPFTFSNGMRWLGRNGLYLKHSGVVEQLAAIDTIVFDKTGTLTQSKQAKVTFTGSTLSAHERSLILSLTKQSSHPLSSIISSELKGDYIEPEGFREVPGSGIEGLVDGYAIKVGSEIFVSGNALQLDALASNVFVAINGIPRGFITIKKEYREGLEAFISSLKGNFELHLISGDNEAEKSHLTTLFGSAQALKFNCSAEDKLNYIKSLQAKNKRVMMIGDGLNDAGALRQSDVGMAISDDVYSFSPSCDAILSGEKLVSLQQLLTYSKKNITVLKQSLLFSFAYNIIGLSFAVAGLLTPLVAAILMPLSSISVVSFATFFTGFWAKNISSK